MSAVEAHLWTARPGGPGAQAAADGYLAVLSTEEHARMNRYRFARDRELSLLSHGLLRSALSSHAPEVHPAAWQLARTPSGRPEIAGPAERRDLRFSLSHTDGLVACLVVPRADCGVDVERHDRPADLSAVRAATLSAAEDAALAGVTDTELRAQVYRYWTLKEAYAKALGLGLALTFDRCSFDLGGERIRLATTGLVAGDAADWQFEQYRVGERHLLAVALRPAAGADVRVVHHWAWAPTLHVAAAPAGGS